MDPACLVAHLLRGRSRNGQLDVLRLVWLHIEGQLALLFTFGDSVAADGHQLSGVVDACDLRSEIVLLASEVEGVGGDLPFEVAAEADLHVARELQVHRFQVRKDCPGALNVIGRVVGVLVDALAARLTSLKSVILG